MTKPANQITPELRTSIEQQWMRRSDAQGLKPKSAKYASAEVDFFVGAMAALGAQGFEVPAYWVMAIMSGRPVVDRTKHAGDIIKES